MDTRPSSTLSNGFLHGVVANSSKSFDRNHSPRTRSATLNQSTNLLRPGTSSSSASFQARYPTLFKTMDMTSDDQRPAANRSRVENIRFQHNTKMRKVLAEEYQAELDRQHAASFAHTETDKGRLLKPHHRAREEARTRVIREALKNEKEMILTLKSLNVKTPGALVDTFFDNQNI